MTRALAVLVGAALAAPALAACGERPRPDAPDPGEGEGGPGDDVTGLAPDRPAVPEVPEEERVAAIEAAMNALAPVAQQCWAAAAADDFRLSGQVRVLVQVGVPAGPGAAVEITRDTTGDETLTRCLAAVLAAYAWAPPLAGQAVELPFAFAAPAMQNVIDRRFVPRRAQAGVEVAVLLDETSTGNAALSLLEVQASATSRLGPRALERLEVWAFTAPARIASAGGVDRVVAAGDVMIAPVGAHLELRGEGGPLAAVVALVPGGREGAARAGALPGRSATLAVRARPPQPSFVVGADAAHYPRPGGGARILVEPPAAGGAVSLGLLELDAGVSVPAHVHARETEALYVLAGGGAMIVAGAALAVTATSVVQVPAGVEHAFTATAATRALQLYTPAGPEQRFKPPPPPPRPRPRRP